MKWTLDTKPLKGLSFRDLELATIIDTFDFDKYMLMPLEKKGGYKKLLRKIKSDEQNESLEADIASLAGGNRFGNKFRSTDYDKTQGKKQVAHALRSHR